MPQIGRRALLLATLLLPACGDGDDPTAYLDRSATVDAGISTSTFSPAHRGHYDLGPTRLDFLSDPAFAPLAAQVPVKSWRISVGRWEIGPVSIMAPEPAAYSRDPALLAASSREFYRGPNTLAGAAVAANYDFAYLDAALDAVEACGAEPYLCFDYMPFTLALNQNPNTSDNLYPADPNFSFSNGIRTSPPADPAVYAAVVVEVVKHVKASRPLTCVEIGNEPDLLLAPGVPARYFWTGTRAQFLAMYKACAEALDDAFGGGIRLAAASFGWQAVQPAPTFAQEFLAGLGMSRLDVLSFHVYGDEPETYFLERLAAIKGLRDVLRPAAELHCPEWGMNLDGGPEFDGMAAALHHAKALEYFQLFDVRLAHRALVRDILPGSGGLGLLKAGPAANKPAAYVFHAFERLQSTSQVLAIPSIDPPGKPMLLAGKSADAVTVLFFHESPGSATGRFALKVENLPFADWTLERRRLTGAAGFVLESSRDGSGPLNETVEFVSDVLVEWRLLRR